MDVLKDNEVWTPFRMFATMMDAKSFSEIIPRKRSVSRTSEYITPPLRSPKLAVTSSPWRKMAIVALSVMTLLYLCGFTIPGLTHRNKKVVIILAANIGGGVLGVKNSGDWMIEKLSIANKKDYAARHGYELVVKDMTLKRKYAHEWRESWEKVDTIRDVMRQFPQHEWFWWLDLYTYIMEPSRSLDAQIFSRLDKIAYRNLTESLNPLEIPEINYTESSQPIDIIVSQDCGGFNLGSFLIRRSEFTRRMMDLWWDPIFYEQKHMDWDHKEQDAFEHMYTTQPYVRSRVGFIPQRDINSFPTGACQGFEERKDIFYDLKGRDFVVNMAGCTWGRNCLEEMQQFKHLSESLNRPWWKTWG